MPTLLNPLPTSLASTPDAERPGNFEVLAISLLLTTPSRLNRAWTRPAANQPTVEEVIDALALSNEGKNYALAAITRLTQSGFKDDFMRVADELSGEYSLPEPHPGGPPPSPEDDHVTPILNAMRALD